MSRKSLETARPADRSHTGRRAHARHTACRPSAAQLRTVRQAGRRNRASDEVETALRAMAGELCCADTVAAAAALCAVLEAYRETLAARTRVITARLDALLGKAATGTPDAAPLPMVATGSMQDLRTRVAELLGPSAPPRSIRRIIAAAIHAFEVLRPDAPLPTDEHRPSSETRRTPTA